MGRGKVVRRRSWYWPPFKCQGEEGKKEEKVEKERDGPVVGLVVVVQQHCESPNSLG